MSISPVQLNFDSFVGFPVDGIIDNSTTDFDLFLKIDDHVVLYGARGYKWFRRELSDLLSNGIDQFFITPNDTRLAEMYKRIGQLPEIDKNLCPRERIVSIELLGAEFTKVLYEGEITPSCVSKAETIASSLIDCVAEDKTCVQALTGLGDYDYYTFHHSMRVACYTVSVAIEMGLSDVEKLKELAIGGIFHDIGKKDIDLNVLNKVGALTEEEWLQVRSHPELGFELLKDSALSHVPKEIILHHHEKLDGSGYPHGLDASSLLPEVQIATLADVFDALTSSRSYQKKRSRYEALDFIRHKMLGTKIPKDPFQALISCLIKD